MSDEKGWRLRPAVAVSDDIKAMGVPAWVAQLLARAGVSRAEEARAFLTPERYAPTPADALPDMAAAVARIVKAVESGEKILIWGDFDVDGITAASILLEALRAVGGVVDYTIPSRLDEGHGVHIPRAMTWVERGIGLIVTVDTGISAHEAIDAVQAAGVDVVVTDHHQLPEVLPGALANVNPQRLPDGHPLGLLSGAGVAYKLAEVLCARLGRSDVLPSLLELAAVGLIADVVPLVRENRYLVQMGLRQLRLSQRQGVKALCHVAKLQPDLLDEEDVAFQIAPRLNALGRLADAAEGVELLTTTDAVRATVLANRVDALNVKRRTLTQQVIQGAEALLAARPEIADSSVLVVAHESWPAGVLGLAASQLAEKYGKPTLVIRRAEGEPARGSARSVEGVNINALLNSHSQYLLTWGGHDLAAGFSLNAKHIDDLRWALSRSVRELGTVNKTEMALEVDLALPGLADGVTLDWLARLAPFGSAFPRPVLMGEGVKLLREGTIGRDRRHLKLVVEDGDQSQEVLMWNAEPTGWAGRRVDLAYTVRPREIGGEYIAKAVFESSAADAETAADEVSRTVYLDWRGWDDAAVSAAIKDWQAQGIRVEVWREGQAANGDGKGRGDLGAADVLVIIHAPHSRRAFDMAIERVGAGTIAVVGREGAFDSVSALGQTVLGAVKFAEGKTSGVMDVERLAARVGHAAETVALCLRWLAAEGRIRLEIKGKVMRASLSSGVRSDEGEVGRLKALLEDALAEVAAFRRFFQGKVMSDE